MKLLAFFLTAASFHYEVSNERGKKASGVAIEASAPDSDGWCRLSIAKAKGDAELVWPFDGQAKAPDGPGPQPVIVVLGPVSEPSVMAAIAAGALLGVRRAVPIGDFSASEDPFVRGVALLYAKKPAAAAAPLGQALKDRERRLTRVPSEIYAVAMLYGRALSGAGRFDDAAVAYGKALRQRPADPAARQGRRESLIAAGKPEAADN